MIRPEARTQIMRWREALIGVGLAAIGLAIAWGALGWLTLTFGALLVVLGVVLAGIGLQRGRFRSGEDGPGIVEVTERQLSYFGPLSGGVAALDDVTGVALDGSARPKHWRIDHAGGPALFIPVTAAGADRLFDAFAGLPNFDTSAMLRALERDHEGLAILWRRHGPESHRRLH
ncbi:hypothetical protein SAMN05421853_101204 [Roseivivax halotolerans]|uniref:Uncharacterized protein n=1 Tax=Roseivivax halotolerans TaxID=93684 RepID=A0A1I5UWZ9_9RHOB|nr:hypothetical protein [Roseivivax halotolerans]SFP99567.1 hypothetical protein SAMN05421853_101204 [Roseivivax halotolerans]